MTSRCQGKLYSSVAFIEIQGMKKLRHFLVPGLLGNKPCTGFLISCICSNKPVIQGEIYKMHLRVVTRYCRYCN